MRSLEPCRLRPLQLRPNRRWFLRRLIQPLSPPTYRPRAAIRTIHIHIPPTTTVTVTPTTIPTPQSPSVAASGLVIRGFIPDSTTGFTTVFIPFQCTMDLPL